MTSTLTNATLAVAALAGAASAQYGAPPPPPQQQIPAAGQSPVPERTILIS